MSEEFRLNLFRVSAADYQSINNWVVHQQALPVEERMREGVYPDAFSANWRVPGQAAFARLFAEQPYFAVAGCVAVCFLPICLLITLLS